MASSQEAALRYEPVRDLGSGNFGVAKLMRDRQTGELVAIKFIERGERVDRNVEREICNHRTLNHPNIVGFKEVFLTPSHLGIVMEFAAGGELFERIVRAGRFSEDEARYFFQQLISGVDYCHASGVCHRDLKLENTLLDGSAAPRLKICDFGYSKSAFDSQPKSTVGTPAYIAPEVLQRKEYNGQPADVWSCGVTLYVMLVGAYPFEDPADPRNFRKTIQRIMNVKFSFPPGLSISAECQDLISRIFVANPAARISIAEIRCHPWFLRNLPVELANPDHYTRSPEPHQTLDEIRALIRAARTLGDATVAKPPLPLEFNEDDYMDADVGGHGPMGHGHGVDPHGHGHDMAGLGIADGLLMDSPGGSGGGVTAGGTFMMGMGMGVDDGYGGVGGASQLTAAQMAAMVGGAGMGGHMMHPHAGSHPAALSHHPQHHAYGHPHQGAVPVHVAAGHMAASSGLQPLEYDYAGGGYMGVPAGYCAQVQSQQQATAAAAVAAAARSMYGQSMQHSQQRHQQ